MTSASMLDGLPGGPYPGGTTARLPWENAAHRPALATGHVGPNVLLQTSAVLHDRLPRAQAERIVRAGTGRAPADLPTQLVDEGIARALVRACLDELGLRTTRAVLREAGHRTAGYLLERRIPRPAQLVLKLLPAPLAFRVLASSIEGNAWTFAGTGHLAIDRARWEFRITGNPMCRHFATDTPMCDFYAGTFERLLSALVRRDLSVFERTCEATGADACVFEVRGR